MRFRSVASATTLLALATVACGGSKKTGDTTTVVAPPPAATPPSAPTGPVVDVKMTGNGTTAAKFEPDHITIAPGTTVRFTNESGGPHNVSFWADSMPTGGADVLRGRLPNGAGDLQSELLSQPNQTLDLSFDGAPEGEYKAYCLPHMALNMRLWITVKK